MTNPLVDASQVVPVDVGYSQFGVLDDAEYNYDSGLFTNGLIRVMDTGAMILTGIDRGEVRVSVSIFEGPVATRPALTDWEEISEVSVYAPAGLLRVQSFEFDVDPGLPVLSAFGPGSYRLRVHACGRDVARGRVILVGEQATEDYLVMCWPSPPQPEVIIRQTDRCGADARAYWSAVEAGTVSQLYPHVDLD